MQTIALTRPSLLATAAEKRLEIDAASQTSDKAYPILWVKNHRFRHDMYHDMTVRGSMPDAKALMPNKMERRSRIGSDDRETFHGENRDVRKRRRIESLLARWGWV